MAESIEAAPSRVNPRKVRVGTVVSELDEQDRGGPLSSSGFVTPVTQRPCFAPSGSTSMTKRTLSPSATGSGYKRPVRSRS